MKKPIIAVTAFDDMPIKDHHQPRVSVNRTNIVALVSAGALPVIVPVHPIPADLRRLALLSDGLYLPGGEDIHPKFFGREAIHSLVSDLSPERDQTEITLIREFQKLHKPIFGVCRGVQILNVALGGDLYQDIPSQTKSDIVHLRPRREVVLADYLRHGHEITITPGSALARITRKTECEVNSVHHQAARKIAQGLCVSAIAPDGIVEALESEDMDRWWVLGVQWHPEALQKRPEARALYRAFVRAASGRHEKKKTARG